MPNPTSYLTTTASLDAIADAIREKGGTSAGLEYPSGFVSAINDISGGGGVETASVTITNDFRTKYYTDSNMTVQTNISDMVNIEIPIGTLIAIRGIAEPSPIPPQYIGVTLVYSETLSRGGFALYSVTG